MSARALGLVGCVLLLNPGASVAQAGPASRVAPPSGSPSPASAPPVTVADLIGLTSIGNADGAEGADDCNVVSPDGSHIAVVVRRGNLARNTVDYALVVFRTADLLRDPKPDTVLTLASSSNRPAIARVRWLADNATLAFLGERMGELPQVYTLDLRTRSLTARTRATTVITAFGIARAGEPVVYAAEERPDTTAYAAMRAQGFVIPRRALVSDLAAGNWLAAPIWDVKRPRTLRVARGGADVALPLPDSADGYSECGLESFSVAPSGEVALLNCTPRQTPAAWAGYTEKEYRSVTDADPTKGYGAKLDQAVVLDLTNGEAHPLSGAPRWWAETYAWAPDGRSIVVANAFLPLDGTDSLERARRAAQRMVAEIDARTGAVTIVARRDTLVALAWDAQRNVVEFARERYPGQVSRSEHLYFRKTAHGWTSVAANTLGVPSIVVEQGLNTPPRLVAVRPGTRERRVVYDPNPGLLATRRFGGETIVRWTTKAGDTRVGGLYWPPDYVPGRRYPLVIQTHGFDSTAFAPDGYYPTDNAAQPLAGAGIIVLQMSDMPGAIEESPREGPWFQDEVESAIDQLDGLGLIDRSRVGLEGFSRTCFHALYFLTHSTYPVAAATVADGVNFSYLQHVLFGSVEILHVSLAHVGALHYGGPPSGATRAQWLAHAPGFNLDRVNAPLRSTALGSPASLMGEWESYMGLVLQGKPAELVYIPDGAHVLVKPWERRTSQQGVLDWYRYWLLGVEDPDPAKAEQYTRWRGLRRQVTAPAPPPSRSAASPAGD